MSKSVNVDFVTRKIEVDTDGKEHFISAAMAAKDAEASMLNAQNAANTAQKIADDLGLVDEAVQQVVANAEQVRNDTAIASNKADIATTQANISAEKADVATTKADAANVSATNAAQSYANADAIATQLTEYLATKETLTAPAVDKTLLIEGAAADSASVGEATTELNSKLNDFTSSNVLYRFKSKTFNGTLNTWVYKDIRLVIPTNTTKISVNLGGLVTSSGTLPSNYIGIDFFGDNAQIGSTIYINELNYGYTINIPNGATEVEFRFYINTTEAVNTSATFTDFIVMSGVTEKPTVSINENTLVKDIKIGNIKNVLVDATLYSVDNLTVTETASTWNYRQYYIYDLLNAEKVTIKYEELEYNNTPLVQNNVRLGFWDKDHLTEYHYISGNSNCEYTFDVPANTHHIGLWVYVNQATAVNTSLTIKGLKVIAKYNNGDGAAHATEMLRNIVGYTDIPSYYRTDNYIDNKANLVKQLMIDANGQFDSFFFITDMHWEWNAHNSPALINYLSRKLPVSKLINGGDLYNCWDEVPTTDCLDNLRNAFKGDMYTLCGNHEYNHIGTGISNGGLTDAKVWYYLNSRHEKIVVGDAGRNYYYLDNNVQKIRYIFLNPYTDKGAGEAQAAEYFEQIQQNWYRDVALGTLQAGWVAVILTHTLYEIDAVTDVLSVSSVMRPILDIADAYNGNGKIACIIQGHSHRDRMNISVSGIPIFITTCDKYVSWYTPAGQRDMNVDRELGTVTEHAFDVVVIDKKNKLVSLVRIGAPARNGVGNNAGDLVEIRQQYYGDSVH